MRDGLATPRYWWVQAKIIGIDGGYNSDPVWEYGWVIYSLGCTRLEGKSLALSFHTKFYWLKS